ncbi:MAG: hypothetical protein AB7O43_18500 [Hyphomicrobiaceae bacterium]
MLGRLASYLIQRAAGSAVDSIERQVVWGGISGVLLIAALVFALVFIFMLLEQSIGAQYASLIIAGGCAVVGVIALQMPAIIAWAEKRESDRESEAEQFVEAVDEEAHAAVDYLGPLQLAASAFMLGYSAAHRIKSR